MAKTSYIDLPTEQEANYYGALNSGDRFVFSKINKKVALMSRKRKKGVSQRSLLPQISEIWATLTSEQKDAWSLAADQMNLTGWKLFVQDMCARIVNEIEGVATPDTIHQSWAGYLSVAEPATQIKIAQLHPNAYYVSQKIKGTKAMYSPVKVTENFSLPLEIGIAYKSDLEVCGENPSARFYARVKYSYQGRDRYHDLEIPFAYSADWTEETATLSSVIGQIIGYTLYIEIIDLRGNVLIDNIKAIHNAQNWVRDPFCKDINQGFTRAFYQIPKHWVAIEIPEGSEYETIYPI